LADLQAEAEQAVARELSWARGGVDLHAAALGLEALPIIPPRKLSEEEDQAAGLIPGRQVRGPIPLEQHLPRLGQEDREAWRALLKDRKGWAHYTQTSLALYWADGACSVLDISGLVELETGQQDLELLLTYFSLLEKLGFVSFP
jgi:hypothetical protein